MQPSVTKCVCAGKLSATEAHLVTQISPNAVPACAPTGCLAVFGVLYDFAADEATRSDFLAPLLQRLPESRGDVVSAGLLLHLPRCCKQDVMHVVQHCCMLGPAAEQVGLAPVDA